MAKKSAASLSVLPVKPISRISPPAGLGAAELEFWTDVVDSKPAEWFSPDNAPLVTEYVRAKVECDVLHARVEAALAGGDPHEIKISLQLRDMVSRRLMSFGTKMRLTQQSKYETRGAAKAARAQSVKKPWEIAKA